MRESATKSQSDQSAFRPSGLTVGPDGALYISDDKHGRIWRVTFHGAPDAPIAAAPTPMTTAAASGRTRAARRHSPRGRPRRGKSERRDITA